MTTDFPPPVGPTTMTVCLVSMVSYSCTTLSAWEGRGGEQKGSLGVKLKTLSDNLIPGQIDGNEEPIWSDLVMNHNRSLSHYQPLYH